MCSCHEVWVLIFKYVFLNLGFLQKLKEIAFGFVESKSPPMGIEDKLDFIHYKVNMWKIILSIELPIPKFIQDEVLLRIHDLHS